MQPKCAKIVRAAAHGREISDAKMRKIDEAMTGAMRELAGRDRTRWQGLSRDQRMAEAVAKAMADIQGAAARKEYNAALQVLRNAETEERVALQMENDPTATRSHAYIRDLENTNNYTHQVRDEAIASLQAMIDAVEAKDGTGVLRNLGIRLLDMDNPGMTADVVREILRSADGHTGNKAAQSGAKAWLEVIERMRQRFNAAGGEIGKLDYGYLSQIHDMAKVKAAGVEAWVAKIMPLLDRERYVRTDGALMDDGEVTNLLRAAHETISTDGDNKTAPGQFQGTGARANRGSDHRVLHFKDGDAWMEYMHEFGEGSLYDAMMGHVGKMARDIGLVERMGPNPEQTHRVQADTARRADASLGELRELLTARSFGSKPDTYWSLINGTAGTPENRTLALLTRDLTNIQTAAKITWGPFSALADVATVMQTLHFERIPYFEYLKALRRQLSAEARSELRTHEVIALSYGAAINRWTGDNMTHSLSGRLAQGVMNLSLMNAWTDAGRNAFADALMHAWSEKIGKTWGELDQWDQYLLQRKGITEGDWSIITQAKLDAGSPTAFLSGRGIRAASDADVMAARPNEMKRIADAVAERTAELSARNAQDQAWIRGRIDKFDDARDSLNRWVKERLAKRLKNNEEATGPMLERMNLLDARREEAQLHADMEADFNRFATRDDVRAFLNAVEDGASADRTDVSHARPAVGAGVEHAETIGRRYGVQKGQLERRMVEIERRIAAMDRGAGRAADADAKIAQKKADAMAGDLSDFIKRSRDRQARRQAVIERLHAEEAPRQAAEAERLRTMAATKWGAMVSDESQFAVVNPDLAARAFVTGGGAPPGSPTGVFWRLMMQFKSFPAAMLSRHWRRVMETPQGLEGAPAGYRGTMVGMEFQGSETVNRIAVLAALGVTTTLLGALQTQMRQVLSGKDPIDMDGEHAGKFWAKAFGAGGGAGFLADVLLAPADDPSRRWQGHLGLFGPVAGVAGGMIDVAKSKHKAADAVTLLSDQAPGVDIWYLRAAYEHWFLHSAQENLNPGYLNRMERRAQKHWNQEYWWRPGEKLPDRAPSFMEMSEP